MKGVVGPLRSAAPSLGPVLRTWQLSECHRLDCLCPLLAETQGARVTNCLLRNLPNILRCKTFGFSLSNKNFIENSWHGGYLPPFWERDNTVGNH